MLKVIHLSDIVREHVPHKILAGIVTVTVELKVSRPATSVPQVELTIFVLDDAFIATGLRTPTQSMTWMVTLQQ